MIDITSGAGALTANTWHHVKLQGQAGSIKLYVDEVQVGNTFTGAVALNSASPLTVGALLVGSTWYDRLSGYMDDIRITKGVARGVGSIQSQEFPNTGATMTSVGYSVGDLHTVTNAAGHVITYNAYDPAGRPRQITDAKGIVTDITYTARGLVSTVAVTAPGMSARTTSYSYDFVGQLTGASLPDGTTLSYTYDAAHRLVGVSDQRGNTVTYTLDTAGNRTAEEVRDSSATLQRNITRSFDLLNRMQQVTGARQ